jgi:hypothetical protein
VNSDEPINVDLTPAEQDLLVQGLVQWGGPASPTDALARAIGFQSSVDLWQGEGRSLRDALRLGTPLTPGDWRRILLATEIVFASDVVGAGTDWPITTGLSDLETITALRAIQKKIGHALRRARPID